jgi:arylsulfatase A-like enzyme
MKSIVLFLSGIITHLALGCSSPVQKEQKQNPTATTKPNFLFIFTDDQRYNTIRALGDPTVHTPNMDRLVQEGVTFTHAYNMGAWQGAVCVASRAMLLSGLTVWEAKDAEAQFDSLVAQGRFWPQRLKQAGYETYMSGKWHIKADAAAAFDHVVHVRPGMPKDTPEGYNRPLSPADTLWRPWDPSFGGFWKGGKHWSEALADDGVGFLEAAANRDSPFFMYLAFNAPHDPRQSPKEFVDQYPLDNIPLPKSYLALYPYKDSIGCGPGLRDEKLAPFPRTPHAVKTNIQEYYAIITHLDEQIGRILKALEESGKRDNTYIIFTSDHGLAVGHHGLLGKQNMYDHSVRVPLMVVGPGIEQGKKLSQQVYLQDVMATTLELAGVEKSGEVKFNSLMPYISGLRSESAYSSIYSCYMDLQRMVRTDTHKLILYPKARKVLLFDLEKDLEEQNDVSDVAAYGKVRKSLMQELLRQQRELKDPLNLSSFFPEMAGL